MPETSQDAFETLYPCKSPFSIEELRLLSNSLDQKSTGFESDKLSADSLIIPAMETRKPRVSRVSVTDLDSCITVPEKIYGYKRESSHR